MKKRKLNKLINTYADELHAEYLDSFRYNFDAGYYRDLLSEVIDKMDKLEMLTRKKWYQKWVF